MPNNAQQKDSEDRKKDLKQIDAEKDFEKQKKDRQDQIEKSRQVRSNDGSESEPAPESNPVLEPEGDMSGDGKSQGNVYPQVEPKEEPVESKIKPLPERGKRFLSKEGDWVITQIEIGKVDGVIKVVNQETLDEIFVKYISGKWILRMRDMKKKKNLRLLSSNYELLIKKAIKIFEYGGKLLEDFEITNRYRMKEIIRGIVKQIQQEVSQSGAVAGYATPRAFVDRRNIQFKTKRKNFIDTTTRRLGYLCVQELEEADPYYNDMNSVFENTIYDNIIEKLKSEYI